MIATTKLLSRAAAIAAGDHIVALRRAFHAFRARYVESLQRDRAKRRMHASLPF